MSSMLPKGWRREKLGDLCDVCRGSSPRPIADQRYFEGGDIPWIKIADATKSGKYLYETKEHVNHFGASFSRKLPKGSLIIAASGTLGYPQFLGVEGCAHDGWLIPANFRGLDAHFLYYFFLWKRNFFYSAAYGAAIQNINTMILREMEIVLPDLASQESISSVLSAYDDLIENNTRRILLLERMAQAIYREWFVHFRFPGHEKVKLVDSPIGKAPVGWTFRPLGKMVSFLNRGISPVYAEDGASVVINQKCIRDQRIDLAPARRQSRPISEERFIRFGDVLINSTGVGTLGRVAQVYRQLDGCTVDTHVTIVRAAGGLDIDYFGCAMCALQKSFERLGVGATGQTELGRKAIEQVNLLVPLTGMQAAFGQIIRPIRALAEGLLRRNDNLRRTRDLLLPKLISGALDVSDLDTETP